MKESFKKAMVHVLKYEGGKVDDPQDPGGRTNQGVTQKTFNAYLASKKQKPRDVYTMKDAERDDIYRSRYWNEAKGDQLPPGIDFVIFDAKGSAEPSRELVFTAYMTLLSKRLA
jgi:lysozyme family protein